MVNVYLNSRKTNALMDTGAGVSVMDMGSLLQVEQTPKLIGTDKILLDASRAKMDILGTIDLEVKLVGEHKTIKQTFYILNSMSAKNAILGVDFMKKLGKVTFDFEKGEVYVKDRRFKTANVKNRVVGRIAEKVTLPARSEMIVAVSCPDQASMITADFAPSRVFQNRGVYAAHCRVTPDINGIFVIKVLNTNDWDVVWDRRQVCGQSSCSITGTRSEQSRELLNGRGK